MEVLPDFEKRNTILKEFNKLLDDEDAAWLAFNKGDRTGDEPFKQIEAAHEKVRAAIDEVTKTDPELAKRLWHRTRVRSDRRPKGSEKQRRELQAEIEKQGCKCAECGGPLDVDQQMMGLPPNMVCDLCCEEWIDDTEKYGKEMTEEEITAAVERERERVA